MIKDWKNLGFLVSPNLLIESLNQRPASNYLTVIPVINTKNLKVPSNKFVPIQKKIRSQEKSKYQIKQQEKRKLNRGSEKKQYDRPVKKLITVKSSKSKIPKF